MLWRSLGSSSMSKYVFISISFLSILNRCVINNNFSECNCDPKGSKSQSCDTKTGDCGPCNIGHEGRTCNKCKPGYYGKPGNCERNY